MFNDHIKNIKYIDFDSRAPIIDKDEFINNIWKLFQPDIDMEQVYEEQVIFFYNRDKKPKYLFTLWDGTKEEFSMDIMVIGYVYYNSLPLRLILESTENKNRKYIYEFLVEEVLGKDFLKNIENYNNTEEYEKEYEEMTKMNNY